MTLTPTKGELLAGLQALAGVKRCRAIRIATYLRLLVQLDRPVGRRTGSRCRPVQATGYAPSRSR
jgi:hypothetical protein